MLTEFDSRRPDMVITLIGMSGAGKSAVAGELARLLNAGRIEVDALIEAQTSERLEDTLARVGEAAFLALESAVICSITPGPSAIISTGGSAVLSPNAMAHLKNISCITYLHAPFETIEARIGEGEGRGIVGLGRKTLRQLYDERLPLYERFAELIINADDGDVFSVARRIVEQKFS